MMRSFAVAFVTIVVVSVLLSPDEIAAISQPRPAPPSQLPVQISGATPGASLELFMNTTKVADVAVDAGGNGMSILDLSNLGKVQMQVYVDVCQDGKVVKVMVVAGQPTPEDQGCRRRMLGGAWWSDCGVTRITLDLTKFGMRVVGCGGFITGPKFYAPLGGAIVVGGLLIAGGGDGSSGISSTPTPPVSTTPPVTTPPVTTPPVTTPPVTTPPVNSTPVAPVPPVTANGNYLCVACSIRSDVSNHNNTLRVCNGVTGTFTLVEGSLVIRHPAPFIEVSGANYNTTSGAFDLSGTGSIAGFNNVAARAVGTVNNQTGRVTFDYTLGANGVFPGGQPITYSITLQKQ